MSRRTRRVNDLLREELSEILRREMRDPRVDTTVVSITEVGITEDMRHAKVYVSVLGDEEEFNGVLAGMRAARPFLQRQLRQRLPDLRMIPELHFEKDETMAKGQQMTDLLNQIAREREGGESAPVSPDAGNADSAPTA